MKSCSPSHLRKPVITNSALKASLLITACVAAQANAQVPLPGGMTETTQNNTAQMQQPAKPTAPIPGNMPPPTGAAMTAYQQLPLNHLDAQTRIESLRQAIATARPTKDLQESVYQLCEWLTDMANAHYKLSAVFSKHDATKAQADLERKQAQKFSQLKNQAQLLKAELLIRQNRYPEALAPLVDIVANEPRSATGQQAYKRLQQIGFSEEVQPEDPKPVASETTAPSSQANNTSDSKTSATISRSTVSVEGYVGTPNTAGAKHVVQQVPAVQTTQAVSAVQTAPGAKTQSQPAKVPMPAPNQVLNVR